MKKVLIINYAFNYESIGSLRARGIAKFIVNYGWEPTILSAKTNVEHDHNFRVIETDDNGLISKVKGTMGIKQNEALKMHYYTSNNKTNKIMDVIYPFFEEIYGYPDIARAWYKNAVKEGIKLFEEEDFNAIISSSPPHTSHMIARELKKRFQVPWIADLRDLWTQNPYYNHFFIRKYFEKRLELKILNDADALTTISKPLKDDLKKIHKDKKIVTVYNGFDPDIKNTEKTLDEKLTIIYSGKLYDGKRDPEKLFKALNELNSEGKINIQDFSVNFYGSKEEWLTDKIKKYHLEKVVNIFGTFPRDEILKKQRNSQLLLLLTWDNPKEYGTIPGKIFEYMAAKRPILSIGVHDGVVKEIIESTNSGIHSSDVNQTKEFIKLSYNEYKAHGEIKYNGIENEINKYSQIEMTKKFNDILNKIVN